MVDPDRGSRRRFNFRFRRDLGIAADTGELFRVAVRDLSRLYRHRSFDRRCRRLARVNSGGRARELARFTEAPEIAWDHGLERSRHDPEALQRAIVALRRFGYDVVALEKKNLIACERRLGQELQKKRLQPRECEGERHKDSLAADFAKDEF